MIKKVFYNSSLPRAGSTLIQNILAQNPDIHTSPTSGLFEMFMASRNYFTEGQEFKAQDRKETENGFRGYLKGAIYGYYSNITDRPYAIDKCRGWSLEWPLLNEYEESPKVICMVRDLRGIFASLEKKYRKNPLHEHNIANFAAMTGTTTEKRIIHWSNNVPTGPTIERLYQVIQQGLHKNILFIRFEDLCHNPNNEMARIYDYFELPYYQHDFENIPQYTHENDNIYGVFGDHKIKNRLRPMESDWNSVLGESACKMITDNYAWFYNSFGYQI
jgi:sulfotransferase